MKHHWRTMGQGVVVAQGIAPSREEAVRLAHAAKAYDDDDCHVCPVGT